MSNKPAPAAAAAAAAVPAAAPVPAPAGGKAGLSAWLPTIATVVLAPVATWAAVEFVVLPRFQRKLAAPVTESAGGHEAPAADSHGGHGAPAGKEKGGPNYEFTNVVVNLAGTMGTRYLKTSFIVTGPDAGIKGIFEGQKPRLTDVTLNVLSSLSLADLEEPGAKNILREKLVSAYNQALGKKVAEQVYFSDFVVQ
ncbi:MAG: flagellar basal body-associated FliL family protein [Verrucomicrobiota bacterium]